MKRFCFFIFLGVISYLFGIEKPPSMQNIEVLYEAPTPEEFVHLRTTAGMGSKKISTVQKAIENTLFWVTLRSQGELIGMGRLTGDGGSLVILADIAVHPKHQRKGYGQFILNSIQEYILQEVPDDAFVCLFSNKAVSSLYLKHGFEFTEDQWPGMHWPGIDRWKKKWF